MDRTDSTDPKITFTSISNTDCLIFTSFTFFVKLYFDMNRQSDYLYKRGLCYLDPLIISFQMLSYFAIHI